MFDWHAALKHDRHAICEEQTRLLPHGHKWATTTFMPESRIINRCRDEPPGDDGV